MKIRKYKGTEERLILTALIVHDEVLEKVTTRLKGDTKPFESKWCNIIAGWCFDYFGRYGKAPRKSIQNKFVRWQERTQDDAAVDLVDSFLQGLSKDYEQLKSEINTDHLIDTASQHFEKVRLQRYIETIQGALDEGNVEEAKQTQSSFESLNFASDDWTDLFSDEEIRDTFNRMEKEEVLIKLRGDLGKFLSPHLERGGFVSFVGPEKRGKSFWLQEMVWNALLQHRRVLYYVLGDMSKQQVKKRFYMRASKRGTKEGEIEVPSSIIPPASKEEELEVEMLTEQIKKLSPAATFKAKQRLEQRTATKQPRLKLQCRGADVLSAGDIERQVKQFIKEGWIPDVIVIDYADLLDPEQGTKRMDFRHQVNGTWKVLRRISLELHCLVLTATQAAASSYTSTVIRKGDFSEDKRKNAHVTGMVGLNQTAQEKALGVYRLNWVFLRDGHWTDTKVCWCAGNLAIARPCMISKL